MTLQEAQARVHEWISGFQEGYWPPLHNLARLVEEVGELARELNHLYGSKPKKPEEPAQDLAMEMADVLFVLLVLANEQKVDLGQALGRVLEKYRVRDGGRWTPRESGVGGGNAPPPSHGEGPEQAVTRYESEGKP